MVILTWISRHFLKNVQGRPAFSRKNTDSIFQWLNLSLSENYSLKNSICHSELDNHPLLKDFSDNKIDNGVNEYDFLMLYNEKC